MNRCSSSRGAARVHSAAYQEERVAVGGNQLIGVEEDLVAEGRHVQMTGHLLHQLQQPGAAVAPAAASWAVAAPHVHSAALTHGHSTHRKRLRLDAAQERQGTLGVFHHNGSERPVKLGGGDFASWGAGERAGGRDGRGAAAVRQAERGWGLCGGLLAPGLLRRGLSGGRWLDRVDALGEPGIDRLPVEAESSVKALNQSRTRDQRWKKSAATFKANMGFPAVEPNYCKLQNKDSHKRPMVCRMTEAAETSHCQSPPNQSQSRSMQANASLRDLITSRAGCWKSTDAFSPS